MKKSLRLSSGNNQLVNFILTKQAIPKLEVFKTVKRISYRSYLLYPESPKNCELTTRISVSFEKKQLIKSKTSAKNTILNLIRNIIFLVSF